MNSMQIQKAVRLWQEYQRVTGTPSGTEATSVQAEADSQPFQIWGFGDGPPLADELLELVMNGKKQATAGLFWSYEAEGEALPTPGDYHVITDGSNTPRCIIRTTRVQILPFQEVPEDFARREGEGDGSLDFWRRVHWEFFTRECRELRREPDPTMKVVCQDFQLVFPIPGIV